MKDFKDIFALTCSIYNISLRFKSLLSIGNVNGNVLMTRFPVTLHKLCSDYPVDNENKKLFNQFGITRHYIKYNCLSADSINKPKS